MLLTNESYYLGNRFKPGHTLIKHILRLISHSHI